MIYLDHAATTPPSPAALAAFTEEARLSANPSSMHRAGFDAHTRLEVYRRTLARTLSVDAEEITFTSGATESTNLALFGAAEALCRRGKKILTTDAEHPCVLECMKELARRGFDVVTLSSRGGRLDLDEVKAALTKDVILAAFMYVNNETGAVFNVSDAFSLVRANCPHAVTFCDCVQAFGKVPLSPKALGADIVTLSAHKICGLRGTGALYVRRGVRLAVTVFGGGQERGLRSGTENTPAIAAFSCAADEAVTQFADRVRHLTSLKEQLRNGLSKHAGVHVLDGYEAACHILSVAFEGYKSEVLLHLLSDAGVCVSSGSACSSKKGAKSPVLLAHGLSPALADCTLRFSLSHTNTEEEISAALDAVNDILQKGIYRR